MATTIQDENTKAIDEHSEAIARLATSVSTSLGIAKAHSDANLETAKAHSDTNLETAKSYADTKASLVDGKVPASQLPSFVDDVLERDTMSAFPTAGETGKIYVAKDTNKTYRWGGTGYVEISQSLALGETETTAYPGDKGKVASETAFAAYDVANNMASAIVDHTDNKNNPHSVTAEQVGAVPLVKDINGEKTAVTIGSRNPGSPVGANSLANGSGVASIGTSSHAEGLNVSAAGSYSHAEGAGTDAPGTASHAEGADTDASGVGSHAEGNFTIASGNYSHAEGDHTLASGTSSHAEGYYAHAYGKYSHAEGVATQAINDYAFVWNGDDAVSVGYSSHGKGTFNINPVGGISGFYIGEKTLTQIINAVIVDRLSAIDPDKASVYDLIKALKGE